MNTYDEVLGHMLARAEEANTKKVIGAYDPDKTKAQNVNLLASSKFLLKADIDPAINFLLEYTKQFYPHATPIIETSSGKQKMEKAADIINVLCAVSPVQCRKCTNTYISTSPENTESTLNCLLCGRASHADCYKEYAVDNAVGIVFLCDPCLTTSETAIVLEKIENSKPVKPDQKTDGTPNNLEDVEQPDPGAGTEQPDPGAGIGPVDRGPAIEHVDRGAHIPTYDEICPLYKENSCPHGLTGKRQICGAPCPFKHPKKCNYHTGKYGSNGCRYSDERCPFYHPRLCENSVQLKMCLIQGCKRTHLPGTSKFLKKPPQQSNVDRQQRRNDENHRQNTSPIREDRQSNRNYEENRKPSEINVWETRTYQSNQIQPPRQPTNVDRERDFLESINRQVASQVNSNMAHMKLEMEKTLREVIRSTLLQKHAGEQNQESNILNPAQPLNAQYLRMPVANPLLDQLQ